MLLSWGLKDDRDVDVCVRVHGIRLLSKWYYFEQARAAPGFLPAHAVFPIPRQDGAYRGLPAWKSSKVKDPLRRWMVMVNNYYSLTGTIS